MAAFDGNRDGHKDTKERLDEMEFRYADRDDDGVLNRKEFSKVEGKIFSNNRWSFACEIPDANQFDRYDTNRDALVDPREYARGEAQERQGKINVINQ